MKYRNAERSCTKKMQKYCLEDECKKNPLSLSWLTLHIDLFIGANFPTPIFNFYIFIGVSRIRSVTKFMFLLDVYIGVDIGVCKFAPLFICNNFTGSSLIYWRKQVLSSSEVLNILVIYIV